MESDIKASIFAKANGETWEHRFDKNDICVWADQKLTPQGRKGRLGRPLCYFIRKYGGQNIEYNIKRYK